MGAARGPLAEPAAASAAIPAEVRDETSAQDDAIAKVPAETDGHDGAVAESQEPRPRPSRSVTEPKPAEEAMPEAADAASEAKPAVGSEAAP